MFVARILAAVALATAPFLAGAPALAVETVVLIPDDRADWRPANLFAFLRPGHNFSERSILVETSPPGATLDLFYIRSNFQKRYEQAEAPARVVLPTRVQAGPRDAVMIRAFLEGYRQREISVRISSKQDRVKLSLDALPNMLVAASHTYFGGRGSLAFFTKEPLQVRVQEVAKGFRVILAETAKGPDVDLSGLTSPVATKVEALQLGEDLLVSADATNPGGFDLRSRQSRDEVRGLHKYSVEMIPKDGGTEAVQRARGALAAIVPGDVVGCAGVFDAELRQSLDPSELSRALAPSGGFTDPYLRAAMKRLGEVSPGGVVTTLDGTTYRTSSPIELTAAMSQPGEVKGYLAILRSFVSRLEPEDHRVETLRGVLAPEVPATEFRERFGSAEQAERACSQVPA
ncbi:MAG: hypothetical protein QNK05_09960 [Myxococcota bacterium]|nr:hypothetical protein [Myxococcota bacterium]